MKPKAMNEAQFLALLEKILPETTADPRLASAIYDRVAEEIRVVNSLRSFEKFCAEGSLPDVQPATVAGFRQRLAASFSTAEVTVAPTETGDAVAVEIALPDRTITNRLKVAPPGPPEDEEVRAKFVPFPVSLPQDPELLWILARREDIGPDEAGILLSSVEEEFWETKAGLQLQRDRVEKTFAEFITHVSAAALAERGLKRHYKDPEPRKTLHRGPVAAATLAAG